MCIFDEVKVSEPPQRLRIMCVKDNNKYQKYCFNFCIQNILNIKKKKLYFDDKKINMISGLYLNHTQNIPGIMIGHLVYSKVKQTKKIHLLYCTCITKKFDYSVSFKDQNYKEYYYLILTQNTTHFNLASLNTNNNDCSILGKSTNW